MPKTVKVAQTTDLASGEGKVVNADGTDVALYNVNGKFHAINNTCLHRGGPLGEGLLEGEIVTCPWHGWKYNVTTGTNVMNPAVRVACYAVTVQGNDVLLELP